MPTAVSSGNPNRRPRHAADLLKLATDPTRAEILILLAEGDLGAREIYDHFGLREIRPALVILAASGAVSFGRSGRRIVYHIEPKGRQLVGVILAAGSIDA